MKAFKWFIIGTAVLVLSTGFASADTYKSVKITADNLNVRDGMTLENNILGKLGKDSVVTSLDIIDGWYKINYNNEIAFISADYGEVINDYVEGYIDGRQVNMRSLPSVTDGVVNKKIDFENVKVHSYENEWYLVTDNNGNQGYVFGDFVKIGSKVENQVVDRGTDRNKLISVAKSRLGSPYKWGSSGPNSFDCSGFIMYCFLEAYDINLGHSSKAMSQKGETVSKENLIPGDLVFFSTDRSGNVNHVGIYLGNGEFIHASSSSYNGKQVAISTLSTGFYNEVYKWGKRIKVD